MLLSAASFLAGTAEEAAAEESALVRLSWASAPYSTAHLCRYRCVLFHRYGSYLHATTAGKQNLSQWQYWSEV